MIEREDSTFKFSNIGNGLGQFFDKVGNFIYGAFKGIFDRGATGVWDDYTGNTANQANIDYQKEYNEQVFKRADSQYQRTIADLRAAGLSSQLAASAPSTIAGSSAAPQRSVGNESQAIERLVSMVTSMKQTDANVALARSEARKNNSESNLMDLEGGSYGERLNLDMVLKKSQSEYNIALTNLASVEGQYKAESMSAQISSSLASAKYHNQLVSLVQKQGSLVDAQILGQYESNQLTRAQTSKVTEEIGKIKDERDNLYKEYWLLCNQIEESIARKNNLDAQSKVYLNQAVSIALDTEIMKYNLNKSKIMDLRTSDSLPSTMWSALTYGGSTLDDILWGRQDSNVKRFVKDTVKWNWKWTPLRWILTGDYPFNFGK